MLDQLKIKILGRRLGEMLIMWRSSSAAATVVQQRQLRVPKAMVAMLRPVRAHGISLVGELKFSPSQLTNRTSLLGFGAPVGLLPSCASTKATFVAGLIPVATSLMRPQG
jgi:hypothetical protein